MSRYYNNEIQAFKIGKIVRDSVIGLVLLILFFCSFGTVGAGERGGV